LNICFLFPWLLLGKHFPSDKLDNGPNKIPIARARFGPALPCYPDRQELHVADWVKLVF
jgi:hypothetical protein